MAQTQTQELKLEQRQLQTISQQQLLQTQLIEMPIQQLAERIKTEMHDNPALESVGDDDPIGWTDSGSESDTIDTTDIHEDYEQQREREERSEALDAALENIGRDDEELPVYLGGQRQDELQEEYLYGEGTSFYDMLLAQVSELELSEDERYVMEYLIRSLDDDGLLRTPLHDIAEELAIYHGIEVSTSDIEKVLEKLQQLDPPGIGARTLQECLLIQLERKIEDSHAPSSLQTLLYAKTVITTHFDEFTKKHWEKIRQQAGLTESQFEDVLHELRRLNPKPGSSMGEAVGRSMQQITPDFIIDTQDDGTVALMLNSGDVPQLQVSQSFADLLKEYQANKEGMSRQVKEALLYTKQKVDAAQGFIAAVQTRQRTLTITMQAIIDLQRRFFEEGDESLLRPMILKDVADRTGLDLSTISRVSNSKYVQTRWGTFPLKFFFSDGVVTEDGEELSQREIKAALREIIDGEDKQRPLSDEALSAMLKEQGYPIARRTVAKYREQMNIPVARLRK